MKSGGSYKEFFSTLGQYVYCFRGPNGETNYIGKGVGDRCLHHIKDKGYSFEDCTIIARNLERFNLEKKDASFLLESYLISTLSPKDNSVGGHYKECFVMANLSFLFDEYSNSQRNMFNEMVEFVEHNRDAFNGTVGFTETRQTSFYLETGAKDNIYAGIKVSSKARDIPISFLVKAGSSAPASAFEDLRTKVVANLGDIYDLDTTSVKNTISFPVSSLDEAVELWESFS